jgi:hypothetical protein
MADGDFRLDLSEDLGKRLVAAAAAAGRPVADYAANLIAYGLEDDWAEDLARAEAYDRTGEFLDAATALTEFRTELQRRFREKRRRR